MFFIILVTTQIEMNFPNETSVTKFYYKIKNEYPHDSLAFTQGLAWYNGYLIEGTGLYGGSSLRRVDLSTGDIINIHNLSSKYFGEGITVLDNKIYQLTWKNQICFVYNASTFEEITTYNFYGEGWGLTTDGTHLIMSNGSSTISFFNPKNFTLEWNINVRTEGFPVSKLNELEYIDGLIYANVWLTDEIIGIDPVNGEVVKKIDFSGLRNENWEKADVFNGISYDVKSKKIFVTGKFWPFLYEIELLK
ncbi:glutaminyl-peptide cyclotransferase [Candidatus Bathyarchaeota archaeon]|nr:glutaminyl-peptide cyclotransferase [Candidatus Bathyarchaeota archaeon]